MTIATYLTFSRILAIPVIMLIFFLPFRWAHPVTAIIFILAAITDWLDGILARRFGQTTPLGEFLDPVADKLLVAVVLVLLLVKYPSPWMTIPAAIIIGREIAISALREWMAELGKRASVAVSYIGKIKTTAQMIALVILLWYSSSSGILNWVWLKRIGIVLLFISAILTLWSMIVYLKVAWPGLTMRKEQ